MAHDVIWAAAGTPNAVFRLTGEQLLRMTAGELADVSLTT
jgi:prolyl-tRNA editing enzyme YbaK/EbsC (Cys-tRNA(Pro) deacylase)